MMVPYKTLGQVNGRAPRLGSTVLPSTGHKALCLLSLASNEMILERYDQPSRIMTVQHPYLLFPGSAPDQLAALPPPPTQAAKAASKVPAATRTSVRSRSYASAG